MSNLRKNPRLYFNIPVTYEVLQPQEVSMPSELARVFQRVKPGGREAGITKEGKLRDLSATGAFVSGEPPELLSRVGLKFGIPGFAKVEAVGWVLWRRIETVVVNGKELPNGFGILFEYLPPPARIHIERLISMNQSTDEIEYLWPYLLE